MILYRDRASSRFKGRYEARLNKKRDEYRKRAGIITDDGVIPACTDADRNEVANATITA